MTDIDRHRLRNEVISDAEADYLGLYEIVWSLNSQYPGVSREAKVAAARDVVSSLLLDGTLSGYRTAWPSDRYEPVAPAELLAAINGSPAWDDPTDEAYFCVAAA